jgi:hypothetical protein
MSFGAPKPPDPTQTANTQQQYNSAAAKDQNKTNSYNQTNSFGAVNYIADPSSPSGFRIDTTLNPTSQAILDTQRGTALDLARNSSGMYSTPFNAGTETAKKLNQWNADYIQPIFNQQDSNLEAKLRNQGLTPGSEAYNNAKNLLSRNQGDFTINYLKNNQGQAFDQAVKEYQMPLQTIAGLEGTMPGNPTFANAPTAQIQPANYQGAVQANYDAQMKNYQSTWDGISKLGTSVLGLAAAPFTGGASLLGSLGSLSGGWGK